MDLAIKISYQVVIIFLYMAIGFTLRKLNKISDKGVSDITTLLLTLVTPCVLISSYQQKIPEYSPKLLSGLSMAALFTILIHVIAIVLITPIFKKDGSARRKVNIFTSIYSNCGFMAIPILSSVLGSDGVFFGSSYLALFTFFYWTHGVIVYSGSIKSVSAKELFLNPGVIGTLIALLLFLFKLELPVIVNDTVSGIAALNTPLSMIVLGTFLAKVNWKTAFFTPSLYLVSFLRLIIIPLISIFLVLGMQLLFSVDTLIARSVLIPAACPAATVAALFAAKYGSDAVYASELVAISTLFSILTLPVMMMVSTYFIG